MSHLKQGKSDVWIWQERLCWIRGWGLIVLVFGRSFRQDPINGSSVRFLWNADRSDIEDLLEQSTSITSLCNDYFDSSVMLPSLLSLCVSGLG